MKFLSKWIGICGLVVLFAPASVSAAVVEGIAAIVNNEVITYLELNEAIDAYTEGLPRDMKPEQKEAVIKQAKTAMLNRMIDNILITQEAKKLGIAVKEEELTAHVDDLLKSRHMKIEQLKEALSKEGTNYEKYRKDLKDHLMKMKLSSREVRSKITISDEEIGEYYGKHRQIYEGKEAVKIKQILFPAPSKAAPEVVLKMKQLADSVEVKIRTGESFDTMMRASEGVADTQAGDDLGFIEKGTMLSEVDEVAFKLKVGEASPVIQSPAGFHIIQVVDKRGAGIKPLDAVREEIKEEIGREKMERKAQDWIQELRKRSYLDIKIQ